MNLIAITWQRLKWTKKLNSGQFLWDNGYLHNRNNVWLEWLCWGIWERRSVANFGSRNPIHVPSRSDTILSCFVVFTSLWPADIRIVCMFWWIPNKIFTSFGKKADLLAFKCAEHIFNFRKAISCASTNSSIMCETVAVLVLVE